MRRELEELIGRMTDDSPGVGEQQSVSWLAHRDAEELRDPSFVDDLVDAIAVERSKERRSAMYFVLGKLGKALRDPRCARRLLDFLQNEKDKYVIAFALDRVGDIPKPRGFDLSLVYGYLSDVRWLVRRSAISALDGTDDPEVERRLIAHAASTEDPYDLAGCHSVLHRVGSTAAIPVLERGLRSRKRDVRMSARLAIEAIRRREAERARH